ncbi:hypothetical protein ACL9RL_09230 [Plantibacter sp. Mn2098]|uniref:hypothetical protein n=1 Tax=Plantibacter sp. Mn2098 TaxID=3395266 RepID=UPI003BCBCC14
MTTTARSPKLLIWIIVGTAALLLLVAAGLGAAFAINAAVTDAYNRGVSSATRDDTGLEDAFDRGMKAGVAYQEWFCTNDVAVTAPLSE